jgi:hypothetical protein
VNNQFNMMALTNGGNAARAVVSVSNLPVPALPLPLSGSAGRGCDEGTRD